MTYPCPSCRSVADEFTGCPSRGRAPDPDAVKVVTADAEIASLTLRPAAAREGAPGSFSALVEPLARTGRIGAGLDRGCCRLRRARSSRCAVLVAGAVSGVAGRSSAVRTAGWLAAAYGVAFAAGQMSGLPLRATAFIVLGTAAAATTARPSLVVEAAAHAGAGLALLLTIGSPRYAAAVLALWSLVVAVRALVSSSRVRAVAAAACELAGWWLLLASMSAAVLEAYTLPAAAVALLAGTLARWARPGLGSWTTHGPALAAALLPTLASVLTGDGHPLRRLLLGAGALLVVLAGAHGRRQAPVVVGGAVLALVALHELALVWDLVPRWLPPASGGLLLVALPMTLERRRRNLARLS